MAAVLFLGVNRVSADCAWFNNARCEDIGVNQQNRCGQQSGSLCMGAQPTPVAKCCCCLDTPLGCCQKINKNTQEKTTMLSSIAQCYSYNNTSWADVSWFVGMYAVNNDCSSNDPNGPSTPGGGGGDPGTGGGSPGGGGGSPGTGGGLPGSGEGSPGSGGGAPLKTDIVLPNPLGPQNMTIGDLPTVIGRVIGAFLSIIGAVALLIVIYGGFVWLTSAGNENRVALGRNTIMWAAIALVIIFLAWMLVGFLFQALGV